jgi:tetratricopeptide (TPR) repeat protein
VTLARRLALAVLLAAAISAAYGRTLQAGYGFVFDDWKLVYENEAIRDLRALPRIVAAAFKDEPVAARDHWIDPGYRPVRMVSYAIDHALFGLDPRGFRLTNILIHLANALLLASIARAFVGPRAALAAALLFALHPVATEAVTYISGRRDVLFAFFYLAALRIHIGPLAPALSSGGGAGGAGRWRGWAEMGLFLLALGAKEMAISLPLACAGADLALGGRPALRARRGVLPAMALAAAAFAGAVVFLKNPGSLHGEAVARIGGSAYACALTMARVFCHYVGLVFFPATLSADYSFDAFPASRGLLDPWTSLAALAALGAALFAIARAWRRGARIEAFLGAFFFVALGPVSQVLVPHPEPIAERYLYLPAMFLVLLAVRLAERAWAARPALRPALGAALALAVIAAGLRTAVRNGDWRDDRTLFEAAVAAHPRCARANLAVAKAWLAESPPRYRDALDPLDRCIEVLPEATWDTRAGGLLVTALFERGTARTALGLYEDALRDLDRVLAARTAGGEAVVDLPRYLHVRLNRAAALKGKGDLAAAEKEYEAVGALAATFDGAGDEALRATAAAARVEALIQLGAIALRREDAKAAIERLRAAAGRAPEAANERAWDLLGRALLASGDAAGAERTFLRWAEAGLASEKEAWYRVAEARVRRADPDGAREALGRALAIDPRFAAAAFSMADLALGRGDLDEAEKWARAALAAAPGERRAEMLLADIGIKRASATRDDPGDAGLRPRGQAAATPRERAERFFALAEQAWAQDRPEGAVQALEGAVEVDPTFAPGFEALGRLHLSLGRPAKALGPLRRALALEPARMGAREALAEAEIAAGEAGALETARAAVEAGRGAPGEARRQALLASALDAAGRPDDARRARNAARAIAEGDAAALFEGAARGLARFAFGEAARAVRAAGREREDAELRVSPGDGR